MTSEAAHIHVKNKVASDYNCTFFLVPVTTYPTWCDNMPRGYLQAERENEAAQCSRDQHRKELSN